MKNIYRTILPACLALACILTVACDKDAEALFAPEQLTKVYGGVDAPLKLTYSNEPLAGKTVRFETADCLTASLTLDDIVPGETTTRIGNIVLTPDNDKYVFSGSSSTRADAASVVYAGSVSDKELVLTLTVTLADPASLAGRYGLAELKKGVLEYGPDKVINNAIVEGMVYANWSAPNESQVDNGKSNTSTLRGILGGIVLPQLIRSVTLEPDGNVRAEFASDEIQFNMSMLSALSQQSIEELAATKNWNISPRNLAYWFEKEEMLYVKLNLNAIVSQAIADSGSSFDPALIAGFVENILAMDAVQLKALLSRLSTTEGFEVLGALANLSDATFAMLIGWVRDGFPLHVAKQDRDGADHLCLYLDKEQLDPMMTSPAAPADDPKYYEKSDFGILLTALKPMLPPQYTMAASLFAMFPRMWPQTLYFELGLDLVPGK